MTLSAHLELATALLDEPQPDGDLSDYIARYRKHLQATTRELRKRQRRHSREVDRHQLRFEWKRKTTPLRAREWNPDEDIGHIPRSKDRPEVLDVGKRYRDVKRIGRSLPQYRYCLELGWSREELDQQLLVRVHLRQSMPSRYDPTKASVSKYLVVFCRSQLLNLAKIKQRRAKNEQVGMTGRDGEAMDAALGAREVWDG